MSYTLNADGVWRFGTETRTLIEDETELEDINYSDSPQVAPDGQQIVEDIVDGAINGLDNFVNEII